MDVEVDEILRLPVVDRGAALLGLCEGQWFERKSGRVSAKDLAVPMVALANAEGGRLVVGLHGGLVEGVGEQQANALRQAAVDFTQPPVRARCEDLDVIDANGELRVLLLFTVEPGEVAHEMTNGDCYLRIGDESRKLTFGQRQELHFDRGHGAYDGTPVAGVSSDAVTHAEEAELWAETLGARGAESLMTARGLLREDRATVAAYLLFAPHPQDRFPHAVVRVMRFEDADPGAGRRFSLDDDADIRCEGSIPVVIAEAEQQIARLLPSRRMLGAAGRFERVPIVPRDAWLEGLVNAVIHRSYSMAGDHVRVEIYPGRVEISSPGRFPGIADVSRPESIARYARNPRIARVCADLRLAQEFGEGIRRIFEEMRLRGLTDPVYEQTTSTVRLTLSSAAAIPDEVQQVLPRNAMVTLDALRRAGVPLGTAEIAELVGRSRPAVLRHLAALREHSLVVWEGKSPKDPRASWRVG